MCTIIWATPPKLQLLIWFVGVVEQNSRRTECAGLSCNCVAAVCFETIMLTSDTSVLASVRG